VASVSKTYAPGGISAPDSVGPLSAPASEHQEYSMLDIVMLALGFGFFALAVGYGYACERL
jgi:hypothetical protein